MSWYWQLIKLHCHSYDVVQLIKLNEHVESSSLWMQILLIWTITFLYIFCMLYLVKYWVNTYSSLLISYLALGVQLFLKWMDHLDPGQRSLARRIQFGWEVLGPRERIVQEKDLLMRIQDLHHLLTMRGPQGKFFFGITPSGHSVRSGLLVRHIFQWN